MAPRARGAVRGAAILARQRRARGHRAPGRRPEGCEQGPIAAGASFPRRVRGSGPGTGRGRGTTGAVGAGGPARSGRVARVGAAGAQAPVGHPIVRRPAAPAARGASRGHGRRGAVGGAGSGRFRAALIDEFQDTDRVQYEISGPSSRRPRRDRPAATTRRPWSARPAATATRPLTARAETPRRSSSWAIRSRPSTPSGARTCSPTSRRWRSWAPTGATP